MITLSCLCGQIRLETATRPDYINECNCTLCRKSGARWAYFAPSEVTVTGATRGWSRTDKAEPGAEVQSCPTCGATTHFVLTPAMVAKHGNTMMGVNMQLAEESDLAGIELRFPDGAAWDGASAFGYVREAVVIGE
ncbi:MAG: aldehyde-activating protein [Candidatus Andeanibacterium colombiense]|uniref:Aldehyde-activating protein n=1 Tax=Candidatus Andeanibacterium colombiense TaxID=3121345 RepID=A0AAJ5X9A1_9SPHN|nr:MAG: aldehyde-activating protein [Sphingomonadaceae bacterium]